MKNNNNKSLNSNFISKAIEIEMEGTVISPGTFIGPICHYQVGSVEQTAFYKIPEKAIDKEINRLNIAIQTSKDELDKLVVDVEKSIGKNEAKIFETHIILLQDKSLLNKIHHKIKMQRMNVEYAVKDTFEEFEDVFSKMDDEYLKDRGTDFSEIKRRLLSHLTGEKGKFLCDEACTMGDNVERIILSKEFSSSMISILGEKDIRGFITEQGSKNAHSAILARAAGIPYITGIKGISKIKCGSLAIIDSKNSKVIFNPSNLTLQKYNSILEKEEKQVLTEKNNGPIVKTKSGKDIEIYANIINLNDLKHVNQYKFAGIGLVRTEFFFLEYKDFPSVSQQAEVYNKIVDNLKGKPVVFRLFDLGGDKRIKSFNFPSEENPLLGLRGIRFLMKYKSIFINQVKAICKIKHPDKIKILYPMISNIEELKEANKIVNDIFHECNINHKIPVGMMFEVPSVFIDPIPFLKEIDFGSIGSNDLVQYVFGVDRNNSLVSYLYNQESHIIYDLITKLLRNAKNHGIDISLCGELNFETNFIKDIINIGINKISFSPVGAQKIIERIKIIE